MSERVKEIRERVERVPPEGPWAYAPAGEKSNDGVVGVAYDGDDQPITGEVDPFDEDVVFVEHVADTWGASGITYAAFIAHARQDIPYLLDRLSETEEKLERAVEQEMEWRALLWINHGCPPSALYGDDGEMQCGECGNDFKRSSPEQIKGLWKRNRERQALQDMEAGDE